MKIEKRMAFSRTSVLLCLFVCTGVLKLAAQSPAPPTPPAGEDWSFPFPVSKTRYAGVFKMSQNSTPDADPTSLIRNIGRPLSWAALNPREDFYNFDYVDQVLQDAKTGGYGVIFRLKCSVIGGTSGEEGQGSETSMVPGWVLSKYGITGSGQPLDKDYRDDDTFCTKNEKLYVAPWHPDVKREYFKFVQEFARRGYLRSPQLLALYVHGISRSAGEEFNCESTDFVPSIANTYQAGGATYTSLGDALNQYFAERLAAWANAAGPEYCYKLIWVGAGNFTGIDSAYRPQDLNDLALGLHMGARGGDIENYYYTKMHPPRAGQDYVTGNYVNTDWGDDLRDGRYWGDENEQSGAEVYSVPHTSPKQDITDPELRRFCYSSSFFRAASLGMNFLWSATVPISSAGGNDGIPGWFANVAGKSPKYSPDAVCWLRQADVRKLPVPPTYYEYDPVTGDPAPTYGSAQPWKNIERFLTQRDGPGAMTLPASKRTDMPYVGLKDDTGADYAEYLARSTDVGNTLGAPSGGSRNIGFHLEPAFKASLATQAEDVKILVHYQENNNASWTVRVAKGSGYVSLGGPVTGTNTGVWKTATFTVTATNVTGGAFYGSGLGTDDAGQNYDFDIHVNGTDTTKNLTVRYVRVVRLHEAHEAPEIKSQPVTVKVLPGETTTLSVNAVGPGLVYKWMKLPSTTSVGSAASLDVAYAGAGDYRVEVSNGWGTATSNTVSVLAAYAVTLDDFSDNDYTTPLWDVFPKTPAGLVTPGTSNASPHTGGGYYLDIDFSSSTTDKYLRLKKTAALFGATWAANGGNAIRFYFRGNYSSMAHGELKVQLREGDTGERWNAPIGSSAYDNSWVVVTVPFSQLVRDPAVLANGVFDLSAIDQIRIYHDDGTAERIVQLDDVQVIEL